MRLQPKKLSRPGAFAPFAAILAAILLGMVAFAVDIGWIVLTKSQLQNAADAAALAGVDPLMDGYLQYHLVGSDQARKVILKKYLGQARAMAKKYANFNNAGDVSNLNLRDEDIEFGFMDADGNYTTQYTAFPNTIKVLLRRDPAANGSLGLFFAPVIGTTSADLTATASATAMAGNINNLSSEVPWNLGVLPITYDVAHWNHFLSTGKDPDGNKSTDADGVPQLLVYPSIQYKGNFAGLSLDDNHVGNNDMMDWIKYGMRKQDILTLQSAGLIPFSTHDPNAWDWNGENGFKASMVQVINDFVGDVYLLPLFKAKAAGPAFTHLQRKLPGSNQGLHTVGVPELTFHGIQMVSARSDWANVILPAASRLAQAQSSNNNGKRKGNITGKTSDSNPTDETILGAGSATDLYQAGEGQGSNFYFNVVGFVGIKIMPPTKINDEIIVQPAAYVDSFATFDSLGSGKLQPAGTHSTLISTFAPPKLTH